MSNVSTMELRLYRLTGEAKAIDKSKAAEYLATVRGVQRGELDLDDPVFVFTVYPDAEGILRILPVTDSDGNPVTDSESNPVELIEKPISLPAEYTDVNYLYAPALKRYYFVTDVVLLNNRQVRLVCHVDVLYSFADYVWLLQALVERSSTGRSDLYDPTLVYNPVPKVEYYAFPFQGTAYNYSAGGESELVFSVTSPSLLCRMVVTGLASSYTQFAGSKSQLHLPTGYPPQYPKMFSGAASVASFALQSPMPVMTYLGAHSEKSSFFLSLMYLPFDVTPYLDKDTSEESVGRFKLGDGTDVTSLLVRTSDNVNYDAYRTTFEALPPLLYGMFRMPTVTSATLSDVLPPNGKLEAYLPYDGWHELDQLALSGKDIAVYYQFSLVDTGATVFLVNATDKALIYMNRITAGMEVDLPSVSKDVAETRKTADTIGYFVKMAGSVAAGVGGLATANPLIAAGALGSAVASTASYASQMALTYPTATVNAGSSVGSYQMPQTLMLRKTYRLRVGDSGSHDEVIGKPNGTAVTLGSFKADLASTYLKVSQITHGPTLNASVLVPNHKESDEIDVLLRDGVWTK